MNKLVLALSMGVAACALAAPAFAADGNKAFTDQQSDGNKITVNQNSNNAGDSVATAGSGGNMVGSSGSSFKQAGGDQNVLTVDQTGSGNKLGSAAQGLQYGTGNTAAVTQAGRNGTVELQQLGDTNGVAGSGGGLYGAVSGRVQQCDHPGQERQRQHHRPAPVR